MIHGDQQFALTTLVRSALFPFGRFARGRRNQGFPERVVRVLKEELNQWLREANLRLPAWHDVQREKPRAHAHELNGEID